MAIARYPVEWRVGTIPLVLLMALAGWRASQGIRAYAGEAGATELAFSGSRFQLANRLLLLDAPGPELAVLLGEEEAVGYFAIVKPRATRLT